MSDTKKPITSEDLLQDLQQDREFRTAWELVEPSITLAANVCRFRVERGWTQTDLAKEAGMRQPRIAEIESGNANPRLNTLARIAQALDVDVSSLFMSEERSRECEAEIAFAPAHSFDSVQFVFEPELSETMHGRLIKRFASIAVLKTDLLPFSKGVAGWGGTKPSNSTPRGKNEHGAAQWFPQDAWRSSQ